MAEIINIQYHLKKKADKDLQKIKEELEIENEKLEYSMEKELNKYVIFDTSEYYELLKDDNKEVTKQNALKHLLTAFDMLVKLNEGQAAIDVENIITRLENNSY